MTPALYQSGVVGIGARALHTTRRALIDDLGEAGEARLQEIGYAAGEEVYHSFCEWLLQYSGVSDPGELDSEKLGEVLSEFFRSLGWGSLSLERVGSSGLEITSDAWAEADPEIGAEYPACYFTTGLLASFLTCLAGGNPFAIMELECRSQGDAGCKFLAGSPETLDAVYEALSEERDYRSILGA
jgi:predicted hydrocarbon binding protein